MAKQENNTEGGPSSLGLAAAIEKVREITLSSTKPNVHWLEVPTGRDKEVVRFPVAFLPSPNGEITFVSLVDEQRKALAAAETARLSTAGGPDARTGTARHETLESFTEHVVRFMDPQNSAVWAARAPQPELVAVLDYHEAGQKGAARWGRHRAVYPCPLSEAWLKWGGGKVLKLSQDQLSAFLQERDMDLIDGTMKPVHGGPERRAPSPSWMLTFADKLEIFSSNSVKRAVDPQTGRAKLVFTEESGASAGDLPPPPGFLVMMRIFEDGEPQEVEIRMTVRVPQGAKAAEFTLQIHDAERLQRDAFSKVVDQVKLATSLPVFQGKPEQ